MLDALTRRLAADPDGPYLDFEGDEYTARRMEAESNRLARALGELGVRHAPVDLELLDDESINLVERWLDSKILRPFHNCTPHFR